MKKLSVVLGLCIIVVMAMGLTACSSYNALKKAFEDAGYTESETLEAIAEDIREEAESESLAITVHGMSKIDGLSTTFVLIVEFKSVEDMKKQIKEQQIDAVILTKTDSLSKGGNLFAICRRFKLPIAFMGTGERLDDFHPFDADLFLNRFLGE